MNAQDYSVTNATPRTELALDRPDTAKSKKIWIDLDNTPHVPFFAPIIRELEARGYAVCLTARDCFQVCSLADLFRLAYVRVGRHYGKHRLMKAFGTIYRSVQLFPTAWREKPALAVSHGSRSQLLAAMCAGIPSLVIVDYEFAKPVPGFRPTWVMVPEIIPDSAIKFGGGKVLKYPGIKEDVYVPGFKRDPSMRKQLGLREDSIIVTVRPPATEAHYHNPESEKLFEAVMKVISQTEGLQAVLLPRNDRQAAAIRKSWPRLFTEGRVLIPDHALDGLNLIWHSELVISGGGTMNREAAALGVPVYSIFRGTIGAVDRYLADCGRLVLLESVNDVQTKLIVRRRTRQATAEVSEKAALSVIVDHIVKTVGGSTAPSTKTQISTDLRPAERGR
jgi:predicted glycosyltransferase